MAVDLETIKQRLGYPGSPVHQNLLQRGLRVESEAKVGCPVDTGRLRVSITTVPAVDDDGTGYVNVGTNVDYAVFVHDGTRFMQGRPFLRDAESAAA
jgi:hypothetical protein